MLNIFSVFESPFFKKTITIVFIVTRNFIDEILKKKKNKKKIKVLKEKWSRLSIDNSFLIGT